jgi:hypothetical protein
MEEFTIQKHHRNRFPWHLTIIIPMETPFHKPPFTRLETAVCTDLQGINPKYTVFYPYRSFYQFATCENFSLTKHGLG